MTPPLEVPMDPLDEIHPEHMTISAELPDFEGDQEHEVQQTEPEGQRSPMVAEEPSAPLVQESSV